VRDICTVHRWTQPGPCPACATLRDYVQAKPFPLPDPEPWVPTPRQARRIVRIDRRWRYLGYLGRLLRRRAYLEARGALEILLAAVAAVLVVLAVREWHWVGFVLAAVALVGRLQKNPNDP
jgi:hypothetical protein